MAKRILFCSYHGYCDPTSGAALSMRDLLGMLSAKGWDCRVFCGSRLDSGQSPSVGELAAQGVAIRSQSTHDAGQCEVQILQAEQNGIPLLIFDSPDTQVPPGLATGHCFVQLLDRFLEQTAPDLVLTYGGHWIGRAIIALAKGRGIRTVFWLRNCEYASAALFAPVDGIIVPCEFSREHYRRALGITCKAIPSPVDWARMTCRQIEPKHVAFVTPRPEKGLFWFAGIAREMARIRPDISFLVVQGRAKPSWAQDAGLADAPNIHVMPLAADPRWFLSQSRMILMPSLWQETFARLPIEAAVNGIPLLASRRGGLPESVSDESLLLEVPQRYTPHSREVPSAQEVRPWVETIMRLWDDAAFHQECARRARQGTARFLPNLIAHRHSAYLEEICSKGPTPVRPSALDEILKALERHLPSAPAGRARISRSEADRLLGLAG